MPTPQQDVGHDVWTSFGSLPGHPRIGQATKFAFALLWIHAGCRPGQICITTRHLGHALGRSARTAAGWLSELKKHGLIEITDRDKCGVLHLMVYRPSPGGGETTPLPDPQLMLPLRANPRALRPTAGIPAQESPQKTPQETPQETAGILTQETPTPRAKTPQNKAPAGPTAGILTQETPRKTPQESAGILTQETPTPRAKTPQNKAPAGPTAGILTQETPPRAHDHIIERDLKISHNHRALSSMDHGTMEEEPSHVSNALADALAARVDPAATRRAKAELVAYLQRTVGDPAADLSIYRRAADLVIEHNYAADELERLAESVRDKRRAGTLRSPGAYFLTSIRHAARRCGLPWTEPAQPKQE